MSNSPVIGGPAAVPAVPVEIEVPVGVPNDIHLEVLRTPVEEYDGGAGSLRDAKRARYSDSEFSNIFDMAYGRIGQHMVQLYEPQIIRMERNQMGATFYKPKGADHQPISIVFDSAALNAFYKDIMPMNTTPQNVAKKHLTLALVHRPTRAEVKCLVEVLQKAREFVSKPRNLKMSCIRNSGCDIVGSFEGLYWEIFTKYQFSLNLKDDRDPHVSF